ncbi:HAD family hydrolase [Tumebacillus sp. ITR2]|uniref:HAD family hydrolase n=1 Tax=Tumebacillus amylolyticus TaxID=2801339 RepID=A0ABS1J830_9BACL|nr:HAD family hydrolase [Tumebacillus amylolyticus]MBL0386425.1 HAD family hydrolase [Tumebacillus amylolyticus]
MDLSKVSLIIYDLDGTLYEDTHHFDYYAKELRKRLPAEAQEAFQTDYETARRDEHPLRIGRTYDANRDLILVQIKGDVSEVYRWDGTPLSESEVRELYPDKVEVNLVDMFSVGDLWWIPGCISRHYGLTDAQTTEAFLATREFMMGPDFHMNNIEGLRDALAQSRANGVKQVLVTNSPQPDSEKILDKIGLLESFDEKVFMARKPSGTKAVFERIKNQFDVPYENILSVGDNWVNEILPAMELGSQTVYIDPHDIGVNLESTKRVQSMTDVLPFIAGAGK